MSLFKRSLTGLNSEFSFSLTSCHTKAEEPSLSYYLPIAGGSKRVHTFPDGICSKVNVIAPLEYELAYYDSAVHRFNQYTTRTTQKETSYKSQSNIALDCADCISVKELDPILPTSALDMSLNYLVVRLYF